MERMTGKWVQRLRVGKGCDGLPCPKSGGEEKRWRCAACFRERWIALVPESCGEGKMEKLCAGRWRWVQVVRMMGEGDGCEVVGMQKGG